MADLPVMLRVAGRRCLIVGGGTVAVRRSRALLEAGAQVRVVAPRLDPALGALPVERCERPFEPGDLEGVWLVTIATDDAAVNRRVASLAEQNNILTNRADAPESGDVAIPAHAHHGPVTLAVHTGGASATAAAAIRRELSAALDPAWPALIERIAPFRQRIQERIADPAERRRRLAALVDPAARRLSADQLERYCERLCEPGPPDPAKEG